MKSKPPTWVYKIKSDNVDAVYHELGKQIIAARQKHGMSQEVLAAHSDSDRSHMGFIE